MSAIQVTVEDQERSWTWSKSYNAAATTVHDVLKELCAARSLANAARHSLARGTAVLEATALLSSVVAAAGGGGALQLVLLSRDAPANGGSGGAPAPTRPAQPAPDRIRGGVATPVPREFQVVSLSDSLDPQLSALPLVIPDNFEWDARANALKKKAEARGKLAVVPEAVAMLRERLGGEPVAALCVAGVARTGKSYILSRALGSTAAFELGNTMDACTYGIWIGVKALRVTTADGKPLTVLLLDTEGIDAVTATGTADMRIFSLSMLLSTLLVFNTVSLPKANDLEKLGAFTELAKSVCIDKKDENMADRRAKLKEMFPSLLWLFRDVVLRLPREHATITDYVTKVVFKVDDDMTPSPADLVRRSILGSFLSFEAHIMAPPSADPDVIQSMGSIDPRTLGGNFERDLAALWPIVAKMLAARGPKRGFDGTSLSGSLYATLLEQYVEALEKPGAVPELRSRWQATVEAETRRAIEECAALYREAMKKHDDAMPLNTSVRAAAQPAAAADKHDVARQQGANAGPFLGDLHGAALKSAYDALLARLPFVGAGAMPSIRRVFRLRIMRTSNEPTWQDALAKHLSGATDERANADVAAAEAMAQQGAAELLKSADAVVDCEYADVLARNKAASLKACRTLLAAIETKVTAFVVEKKPAPTFDAAMDFADQLVDEYLRAARGPAVDQCLNEWYEKVEQTIKPQLRKLADYDEQRLKDEQELAKQAAKNEELSEKYAAAREKLRNDEQMRAEQEKRFVAMMDQLKADQAAQLEAAKVQNEQLMNAQMKSMEAMMKQQQDTAAANMEVLRKRMDDDAKANQESMKALADAIAKIPPPPPPSGGGCCVSMHGLIEVRGRGVVRVRDVEVGDAVLSIDDSGRRTWTEVYWREMRGAVEGTGAVRVEWADDGAIVITGDHLMYVVDDAAALRAVPAKQVRVGDRVKLADESVAVVRAVERVRMRGLGTLLTLNHAMVVDGVLVSCYELSLAWGALESLDARLMYRYAPALLHSRAYQWFCKQVWDDWSDGVFKRAFNNLFS